MTELGARWEFDQTIVLELKVSEGPTLHFSDRYVHA